MPHYRILALDIDGTLVNSRDELTPATRAALRRAMDAGVRVLIVTGRRYSRVLPVAEALGVVDPLVTSCGALIKRPTDHRTVFRTELQRPVLQEVLDTIDRAGYDAVLYADTYGDGFDYYLRSERVDQPHLAEFLSLNVGFHREHPMLVTDPPEGVFAGFAIGPRDEMLELERGLQARVPGKLYTHVLRSPRYSGWMCEIAPAGITKWSGLERLARTWGVAAAEICAVGDDVNDLPMIEAAGLGVAMGNAQEEVLRAADRVAPKHDEDGLVQVVDWVLG